MKYYFKNQLKIEIVYEILKKNELLYNHFLTTNSLKLNQWKFKREYTFKNLIV